MDVEVPSDGVYERRDRGMDRTDVQRAVRGATAYAKLSVDCRGRLPRQGDTWYRDMRSPGFNECCWRRTPTTACSGWRRKIVADEALRRGDGEVLVAGGHGQRGRGAARGCKGDADFEGLLLAANAQSAEVDSSCATASGAASRGRAKHTTSKTFSSKSCSPGGSARTRIEDDHPVRRVSRFVTRELETTAHTRRARAQDGTPSRVFGWDGNPASADAHRRAAQPFDRSLSASVRRYRLGRYHGAGAGRHLGDGRGSQAARCSGELSRRHA